MAGFSIQLFEADAGNSNAMIVSTGKTVTIRVSPYGSTTYILSEVGSTGVYNIATVNDGVYKLYVGGVEQTQFGTFWIGDDAPRFDTIAERTAATGVTIDGILLKDSLNASSIMALTGNQTATGIKTFSSVPKASAAATQTTELIRWDEAMRLADDQTATGIKTFSSVPKASAAATQTTELIRWDETVRTSDTQTGLAGNKAWTGVHAFGSNVAITGTLGTTGQVTHYTQPALCSVTPTNDSHYARKKYVDDAIASATGNYTDSVNVVWCMPEISADIENVAYNTMSECISSFSSPAETNQCLVEIQGTGTSTQYVSCPSSALIDYVHIRGTGKHICLELGGEVVEATTNHNLKIENCSVFIGANFTTAARTMENLQFINCDIYFYNDITFSGDNGKLHNCILYSASGKDITFDDGIEVIGCKAMQNSVKGGSFTGVMDIVDNLNTSYTPPTDPSPTAS